MLGFGNAVQSDVVDAGLLLFGFTPLDPSLSLIKFAQGTKLVTRHRFIGVEHGRIFTAYQTKANQRFDRMSKNTFNELYRASNGYKDKFTRFKSPITMFEYKTVHVVLYLLAWLLKLAGFWVAERVAKDKKASKLQCHFVNYQQKFSFLVFQLIVIDLWFFGIRNIFHTDREYMPFQKFLAIACVLLSVFDILEIIQKTREINFGKKKVTLTNSELQGHVLQKNQSSEMAPNQAQTKRKSSTSPSDGTTGDSVSDSAISLNSHEKNALDKTNFEKLEQGQQEAGNSGN